MIDFLLHTTTGHQLVMAYGITVIMAGLVAYFDHGDKLQEEYGFGAAGFNFLVQFILFVEALGSLLTIFLLLRVRKATPQSIPIRKD